MGTVASHQDRRCAIAIDSRAAISVIPKVMVMSFPAVTPRAGERVTYHASSGQNIKDVVGQNVEFLAKDGRRRAIKIRVAEVTKPLGPVSRICRRGNRPSSTSRVPTWITRGAGSGRSSSRGIASTFLRSRSTRAGAAPRVVPTSPL